MENKPEPGEVSDPDLGVTLDEDVELPFDDKDLGEAEEADVESEDDLDDDLIPEDDHG